MDSKQTLINQYSGDHVLAYEAKRRHSPRWARECEVFASMMEQVKPNTLLDAPVGTCRWAEEYATLGLKRLYGLDASSDMLAKATAAANAAGLDAFTFNQCDLLNERIASRVSQVDCMVCIRFLNWICADDVAKLVANLTQVNSCHLLLGVSLSPQCWGALKKNKASTDLFRDNLARRFKKLAPIYVHEEVWFEELLNLNGWNTKLKEPIFDDSRRVNFFYLLEKSHSSPAESK